jgi:pimeloyl-ACP methyl ester carboxylesterase
MEGSPRQQAAQIWRGLDRLGIAEPILVGHSMGALVSLAMAERFPDRVRGLVLVAPLGFPEPRPMEHLLLAPRAIPFWGPWLSRVAEATVDGAFLRIVQRFMFAPAPVPDHWQAAFPYDEVLDARNMVAEGEDAVAILPGSPAGTIQTAAIPTLTAVMIGTQDRIVVNVGQGRLLAATMPRARLHEVRGAGHMIHHTHTDRLVEAAFELAAELGDHNSAR